MIRVALLLALLILSCASPTEPEPTVTCDFQVWVDWEAEQVDSVNANNCRAEK